LRLSVRLTERVPDRILLNRNNLLSSPDTKNPTRIARGPMFAGDPVADIVYSHRRLFTIFT